jgi:hypothetical protein
MIDAKKCENEALLSELTTTEHVSVRLCHRVQKNLPSYFSVSHTRTCYSKMSILGFDMDWFDPISELTHRLYLKFFLDDNTIEILSEKSAFLKRIYYPEVKLQDLFVGNSITMFVLLIVYILSDHSSTSLFVDTIAFMLSRAIRTSSRRIS